MAERLPEGYVPMDGIVVPEGPRDDGLGPCKHCGWLVEFALNDKQHRVAVDPADDGPWLLIDAERGVGRPERRIRPAEAGTPTGERYRRHADSCTGRTRRAR